MRLGRIEKNGIVVFAVARDEGPWTPLDTLAVNADDTAAVIASWSEIEDKLTSHPDSTLDGEPRMSCPVVRPGKMIAIGLNYMDHIRETKAEVPERPIAFAKYSSSLTGPYDDIEVDDRATAQADYEAELVVVMGRNARRVRAVDALSYVFGYCVGNDVSARDEQKKDSQFSRSKSMDTFCPVGPWIVTAGSVGDPQDLRIRSWVNEDARQDSTTAEMIFSVATLIEYLSATMTLEVGDVILTGTPHGVGFGRTPPSFLQPGDEVRCEIDLLGGIHNKVVAAT